MLAGDELPVTSDAGARPALILMDALHTVSSSFARVFVPGAVAATRRSMSWAEVLYTDRGVRELLEAEVDFCVVGEAGSVDAATALIPLVQPDVVVLDVRLPDGNGINLCKVLIERRPCLRCVILTSFEDGRTLIDAAGAGASAFVTKQVRAFDLAAVIRQVGAGRSLLTPRVVARAVARLHQGDYGDRRLAQLSGQERRAPTARDW